MILMSIENHFFSKKAIEDSENGHLGYALKSRFTFLEAWIHHTKKEFYYAAKSRCSVSNCAGEKESTRQLHGGFVAGDKARELGAVFSILLPRGGPDR